MNTHATKINLLAEMIAFSIVDGKLHEREHQFLALIAQELNISQEEFNDLFHQEFKEIPIKSEAQRVLQFYRLALLMHADGVLHEKEAVAIKQIGLDMGLNPSAINRMLQLMVSSNKRIISPAEIFALFKEQHN